MCGRATFTVSTEELREMFEVDDVPDLPRRFNIAPSLPLPILRRPGKIELVRWGDKGFINARVEVATVRPELRCLVVLDGFYEWRKADRQPFYFHRVDRKPFAVGGVLRSRGDACAIVTCPPDALVSDLHSRMPLVLGKDDWPRWLAGEKPAATLLGFERYAVSRLVNSPANDVAACVARAPEAPPAQPELPNLFSNR